MESLNCLLTIHISVLEKGAKAAKDSAKDLKKADEEDVKTSDRDLETPVKKEKDSVMGLKQADEEDVKRTDKDLGTPVEKEIESSVTDLVVPVEKRGKREKAFVEGPTSSELEPGKYIN